DVVVDVLLRPVVGRSGKSGVDRLLVPVQMLRWALVLVDAAERVPELVYDDTLVFAVGRIVLEASRNSLLADAWGNTPRRDIRSPPPTRILRQTRRRSG